MHPCYSEADDAFRREVRDFIAQNLSDDLKRRARWDYHPNREDQARWCAILDRRGWSVAHWPVAYGGPGWSGVQRFIFEEEMRRAYAPTVDRIGPELVGPVIYTFGSEEMKARFLPDIRQGKSFWAQGFSEPGAGSDLAMLRTRADRDGGNFIVNGQKTWTTEGHHADWIFLLVRTNREVKPQQGISALLVDLQSPGVVMRPIRTLDEGVTVNEVFFDNVIVGAENLVGEEGAGWTYAKFLLSNERTASAEVPHTKRDIAQLRDIAAIETKNGRPLMEDTDFRRKLARIEIDTLALEYTVLRVLANADDAANADIASLVKVRGSELRQRVADLADEALGDAGLAVVGNIEGEHDVLAPHFDPPVPAHGIGIAAKAMFRRATTIYGGANEIQRTLIARTALRL
jgi:alkylation response protein AidB-like acyl-CoA dehydrogenase